MSKNEKILVTGGAGYVGSILVPRLLNEGFKVRVVDFLMFGGESLLGVWGKKNFDFIKGDLREKRLVEKSLEGIHAVVHLAALVGQEACNFQPKVTQAINYEVTRMLADACRKKRIERFIFASTCSNYGIHRAGLAQEDTPLDITSLYAETKVACEKYLQKTKTANFHPCILRLAMKFGLSPKMRFNLIVNDFAREAVLKNRVLVYGPQCWRAFTHVQDAADVYLTCLKAPLDKISGEVFNVGTQNYQKRQLLKLVKKYIPDVKVETIEEKKDLRDYRVDFTKIKKVLGFKPKKTVEEGFLEIKDALEKKIFTDPYDPKYEIWYNPSMMKVFKRR
ncbi:NAD(P)-dependent oxidoreductase [Patescibacteria group bacterium]|nr:NAD(P)-dependent oxidoreductase [Patescibacteria group bacterium]